MKHHARTSSPSCLYSGFTLIEILVVLVILAIVTAIAALSVSVAGVSEKAKQEAERLLSVINFAEQQALLQASPISLKVTAKSYQFFQYGNNAWQAMPQAIFGLHQLPMGVSAKLQVVHQPKATRVVFSQAGAVQAFVITLERGSHVYYRVSVDAAGVAKKIVG